MRKFLTFLLMSLMTTVAWGVKVVTFLPEELGAIEAVVTDNICMTRDCVTICCSRGLFSTAQFRFYKSSVVTVTSTCGPIIKVVFECTAEGDAQYGPCCFTVEQGDYGCEGKVGTWVGEAEQVKFTAATSQVRATRIDVYIDDGGLSAPKITPVSGTYYAPIEVAITCLNAGAKIYYTLNGSNPTTSSQQYTAPFTLSSKTTVKAIAELDGEVSDVVCADYEILQPSVVNSLAEYQLLDDETAVQFGNPVYVTAQNQKYLYVKDNTGYAVFYGDCGQVYRNGDMIPVGFCGTKTTYSCEPELKWLSGFQPAVRNIPVEPEEITADQIGPATAAHYVIMKNVTLALHEDGKTYIVTDAEGNSCPVYFGRMGISAPIDLTHTYDIIGVVGSYGKDDCIYQLLPTALGLINPDPIGFGMLEDIDDNTEVMMTVDATVIAQKGMYLYAFDETGYGVVYGDTGQTYKMGDVIPAGFGGLKTTYSCEPELKNPHDFQAPIGQVELEAKEITIDQVNHSTWGHYVVIRNVWFNKEGYVLHDVNGNECRYYNRFGVDIPSDLAAAYDVYGVVGSYGINGDCIYQILPLRIVCVNCNLEAVCCIEDLLDYPQDQVVEFECPLIVLYQSGNYLYVKDQCDQYTLMYGRQSETFVNGDTIIGFASWTRYPSVGGFIQLRPVEDWHLVAHGPKIPPVYAGPIEEINQTMIHWYICFEDVTVTKDEDDVSGRYYTMSDETGEMKLYNQLGIEIPTDYLLVDMGGPDLNISFLNRIIEYILTGEVLTPPDPVIVSSWSPCRVEGFLSVYRDQLELRPTHVTCYGTHGGDWQEWHYYDLNSDGAINISDLNLGIDIILRD